MDTGKCPVCSAEHLGTWTIGTPGSLGFDCPRCGRFKVDNELRESLPYKSKHGNAGAILSHMLYQMTRSEEWPLLTRKLMDRLLENNALPRPAEQFENLILWIGENQGTVGAIVRTSLATIAAIGTSDVMSLHFLLQQGIERGLFSGSGHNLTMTG